MDIKECRIDMGAMTETGRIGRIVAMHENGTIHIMFGSDVLPSRMWASELTPVSDPGKFAKGDKVRAIRKSIYGFDRSGETLTVINPEYHCSDGRTVIEVDGGGLFMPDDLVKCDSCASCEMATTIISQCKQIAELQQECEEWQATAQAEKRNAAYWRLELTKLQNEALAGDKRESLSDVIGHYFPEPDKLLMSDDARIICELLEGSGPLTSWQIAGRLMIREICVLESIIEARGAGKISLVDGKYEIVRD